MQLDMLSFVDTRILLLLAVTSYLATGQRKCFQLVCGMGGVGVAVLLCALSRWREKRELQLPEL